MKGVGRLCSLRRKLSSSGSPCPTCTLSPMLITQDIETGPNPTASLIILHGLGADGSDFVPFCSELTLEEIGPVRFVLPSAPVLRVSLNNGYPMQAWYDILPTNDTRPTSTRPSS